MSDANRNSKSAEPQSGSPGGQPEKVVVVGDRGWVPVMVAAALAGLALLLLHIPGVLQYPTYPVAPAPVETSRADDAQRLAAEQERNAALRQQIARAKRLLEQNVCVKEGDLFYPIIPKPGDPAGSGGLQPVPPADEGGLISKPPEKIKFTPRSVPTAPNFEGNLVELLERSTVLVISPPNGRGSGFVVAPGKIVTNRHVVANNPNSQLFVANRQLGGVRRARVVAATPAGDTMAPDYALISLDGADDLPVLPVAADVARLQRVIAAGFPGIVTMSDEKNAALNNGDASAIPEMAVTQGAVTVVQNRESGRPIVGHEATISPGSSGGPLVDECGRLVGVNTFGLFDQSGRYHANYAQGVGSLLAFLSENGIRPATASEACGGGPKVESASTQPPPPAMPPSPGGGSRPAAVQK